MPSSLEDQEQDRRTTVSGTRVREIRKLLGLTQTQLAEIAGTSNSLISMVEQNQTGPSLRNAALIAKALGTSMDYLLGWVDDARRTHEIVSELNANIARVRDLEDGHAEPLDPDWHEYVGIDEVDMTVGTNTSDSDERVKGRVKFQYPWLRKHGLKAHMCRIVRVAGESMEPTVPDGCAILVDGASTERRDGGIFVLRLGGTVLVRRVIHDAKAGWLLLSDNPDKAGWPTRPWPDHATIVGEVKWLGRTFR